MKVTITKLEAKTVQKQGPNFGKKYCVCTVEDEYGNEQEIPVFDKEAKPYLDCIATAKGGNAAQDLPIPEKKAVWPYIFAEEFLFPEPMVRIDPATGKPQLSQRGQMYVRNSVMVTTRYFRDDDRAMLQDSNGKNLSVLQPLPGWDRVSRGTSVMNAFYEPLRLHTAGGADVPGGPMQQAVENSQVPV